MPALSRTTPAAARAVLALALGLGAGAALFAARSPLLPAVVAVVEPIGSLWVNAIRATVIPLVVSLLVTSVGAAPDARRVGRLGARALVLFLAMLTSVALFAALVTPAILAWLPIDAGALGPERAATVAPPAPLPGVGEWLVALVPTNPVAAAVSGAILPLVVFALIFALAARRLAPGVRAPLVGFFTAVAETVLVLVRWILALAPVGIFALALVLGARAGAGAAGALAAFVLLVAAICVAVLALLYAVAVLGGRVSLRRFARAAGPAQAIAFSSRSSLAALPAMVAGAESQLGAPAAVTGFFLPLAVSTFKLSATIAIVTGTLFLARLYGVALSPGQLAAVAAAAVLLSFSVPGVPGGVILIIAPVLASVGIPAEGVGVLLAIDVIPDMFRTLTNVTANVAAAAILARGETVDGVDR